MPEQRLTQLDAGRKMKDDVQTEGGKKVQEFDGGFFFIFIILIFFFMMPFGFFGAKK